MTEQNVPLQRTTFGVSAFAKAVIAAWKRARGSFPSRATVGVLWAQYALETGRGAACWNFNLGNVKHTLGDGYDYVMLAGTWEVLDGKRVVFQPPHPQTWFRAYASLDAAMRDHLELLVRRFAPAWPAVEAGDPVAFAHELKRRGYYTAPEADYARGLASLHREFMSSFAYDEAMGEIARVHEAETVPQLPAADDDTGAIIRPEVEFQPRKYDD
jgi:hypothetical protein